MRSIILRYFNASGADPASEIGEDHEPEPHLIPRALMAAAGELQHLEILGTDYATPDGIAIRDYIHVTDLAGAHVRALRELLASETFNVGTGLGHSVRAIVGWSNASAKCTDQIDHGLLLLGRDLGKDRQR